MKNLVKKLLVAACALYLSGAHFAVLQVAAWTTMLVERTEEVGLAVAAKTTFSGEAPCALCRVVQTGQNQERKETPGAPSLKKLMETKLVAAVNSIVPRAVVTGAVSWPVLVDPAARRMEAPLTPPPQSA